MYHIYIYIFLLPSVKRSLIRLDFSTCVKTTQKFLGRLAASLTKRCDVFSRRLRFKGHGTKTGQRQDTWTIFVSHIISLSVKQDGMNECRAVLKLSYKTGPRNKRPSLIDYALRANEINRARIDGVVGEILPRGLYATVCNGCTDTLAVKEPETENPSCCLLGWEPSTCCTELRRPPLLSGSVQLKSDRYRDGIWQTGSCQSRLWFETVEAVVLWQADFQAGAVQRE